jgi:hypothetical protein
VKRLFSSKQRRGAGRLTAGLMLLLWLGTFAMTVFPELHCLLHEDAKDQSHHCLVTQIQQQPLLAGCAPVLAPIAPPAGAELVVIRETQFFALRNDRLALSRAPPSVFSTTTVAG